MSRAKKVIAPSPIDEDLTGVAFTVQAAKKNGPLNCYHICILFFVDGQLVHIEKSQEYASFDAIERIDENSEASLWNLSMRFRSGDYQSLGGDSRDELVNRLKKTDPDLLAKIAPALHLPEEALA